MSGIINGGLPPSNLPPTNPDTPDTLPSGGVSGGGSAGGVGSTSPAGTTPVPPTGNVTLPTVSVANTPYSPLDRPKITLPSDVAGASVGDLIEEIQDEIQKTSDALAKIQNTQIQEDANKQQAANKAQIAALNKAASQIEQAVKEQAAMKDVQWAMMALAIFITVCTAGTLGVIAGPLMVAGTVATQVPIDGQNATSWLTTGVGEGFADADKSILEDNIKDGLQHMSASDQASENSTIDQSGSIQASAFMIAVEVIIAVVVSAATLGAGAPEAVGGSAGAITETTLDEGAAESEEIVDETLNEASQEIEQTVQQTTQSATKSLDKVKNAVNLATQIPQIGGQLTVDGISIHTAYLDEQNSENQSSADQIKAFTKFLQTMLNSDEDFLKEIVQSQSNIADTVKDVLQTEHSTNMHIANLTTNA